MSTKVKKYPGYVAVTVPKSVVEEFTKPDDMYDHFFKSAHQLWVDGWANGAGADIYRPDAGGKEEVNSLEERACDAFNELLRFVKTVPDKEMLEEKLWAWQGLEDEYATSQRTRIYVKGIADGIAMFAHMLVDGTLNKES